MNNITETADKLGEMIKATPEYADYAAAKTAHDADMGLQALIGEFNLKRMSIGQLAQAEDRDQAKIEQLQSEIKGIYDAIMGNDNMKKMIEAKEKFDVIVNGVYGVLNFHITGKTSDGCGGSCDSCAGCS